MLFTKICWLSYLSLACGAVYVESRSEGALNKNLAALASDDFDEREAAYRALADDPRAEAIVQRHRDDADPEVRQRIAKLLAHYTQARAERAIRRGTLLVSAGNVDLMPDLMRTYQEHDPKQRLHGSLCIVLSDLCTREKVFREHLNTRFYRAFFPERRDDIHAVLARPPVYGYRHPKAGEPLERTQTGRCVVCPADAEYANDLGLGPENGILLADSVRPSKEQASLKRMMIICNGDIRASRLDDTLVICDGVVEAPFDFCLLIARGGIRWKQVGNPREIAPGKPNITGRTSTVHVPAPGKRSFGLIRFFEVSDVGLTLDACKITKVVGPLAKAGVKSGDIFTHVDGVAVKDAEALRKALRRRYAILGYGAFTLTREGKPLTVVAELGD